MVTAADGWAPIFTGPGGEYPQVGEVVYGLRLAPLGRYADGSWIGIHRPGYEGLTAWVTAVYAVVSNFH